MPYTAAQIDDIVNAALETAVRQKWVDMTLDLQHLIFVSNFLDVMDTPESGGNKLTWMWQIDEIDTARASGLFDVDSYDVKNLLVKPEIAWSHQTANWIYDINEEAFNGGAQSIVDHVGVRSHSCRTALFNFLEKGLWYAGKSTDSPPRPAGIPYWITNQGATSTFGFNGGNHTDWSSGPGGISRTTYTNTKNGCATYAVLDDDDGLATLSKAVDYCHFQPADPYADLGGGKPKWWLYTTYTNIQRMQRLMMSSNDNVGTDLGKYRGIPVFRSIPVRYVPALENTSWTETAVTDNPIYGINMNTWKWVFKSGRRMKVTKPIVMSDRHNQRVVHIDNIGQFQCLDPKRNFVLTEA